MKVLQLIDSLTPGGAERIAVTLANELSANGFDSFLCASRAEGLLKESISSKVQYIHLKKQHALDVSGLIKLFRFIKLNEIEIIHAHSSSFFWATMVKIFNKRIKLIWHDHYGNSEHLDARKFAVLRWCSAYFNGIISVNDNLRAWAFENLRCKKVRFIRNFVIIDTHLQTEVQLQGQPEYRIICLANLRPQKDHFTLLEAFKIIQDKFPGASLHLVGSKIDSEYFNELQKFAEKQDLNEVYFHGSQKEVQLLLKQGALGVLSSQSEGLPLALLEYGISGLPVVCTRVGECEEVLHGFGKLVPAGDTTALAEALLYYLAHPEKAQLDAERYRDHIKKNYSFQAILPQIKEMYTY